MSDSKRKILLVVDGSYQSFETVHYLSEALPPSSTEVVLLHVMSRVPEAFWDLEKDPAWQQKVQTVKGWEVQQEKKISDFMKRAGQVFADAGFPSNAIKVDVRNRNKGIARDIGEESHKGYDAVIIGRRGLSTIQDLSLGGVASKVVLKVRDLAVWLVGGKPEPDKIIIGFDASDGAMLAVDHVGKMAQGTKKQILLLHVIRKGNNDIDNAEFQQFQKERMQSAVKEIEPVIENAVGRLVQAGIPSDRISSKVITGATTRAGSILEEAKAGDYGTVVVGRRGVSTVEEFDMGRVSNKLVQAAKDRALWVVG